ncbi:TetR/AcrR family transcriptional regulator [Streptomyces sp. NBC_00444]|uniref:TetR/AcrR family transcriptional regulator n=1 Tax=Streptomyces sp. NBC_00444 TaxID=2975744 RepID=UPI002E1F85A0
MPDSADSLAPSERERLLRLSADYVLEHGVAGMTLRRLGQEIGTNNRMLLYYFGSKEELILAALVELSGRYPVLTRAFTTMDDPDRPLRDRIVAVWEAVAAPENIPFHRVFFEVLGLAAHQRGRFDVFLGAVSSDWRSQVSASLRRDGVPAATADALARELVALWRGLQIDLITSGDLAGTRAANAAAAASVARQAAEAVVAAGAVGA